MSRVTLLLSCPALLAVAVRTVRRASEPVDPGLSTASEGRRTRLRDPFSNGFGESLPRQSVLACPHKRGRLCYEAAAQKAVMNHRTPKVRLLWV